VGELMRVLMLTTDLRLGGVERTIINRAECLRDTGVDCAVAGLLERGPERGEARRRLEELGFTAFCAGIEGPGQLGRLGRLRRFVLDWEPDVLHAHLFHGHLAAWALRVSGVRTPQVWSHHASAPRPWRLRRAFYRLCGRAADAQVYVSEAVMRYQHSAAGPADFERVIHNGADLRAFLAIEPRPGPVFGAVGRLVPLHKGFDVLIRAFARLPAEESRARLRIAGEGPERGALEGLARAQGVADRVEFAGFVTDVPGFLASVNVFVNPSRWEAFGNTLVEGMAAGLPCIASRVQGLPEIGDDLVTWVEAGDVAGLCRAMAAALGRSHPIEKIARQRRRMLELFSRERMARDYLALYREVVRRLGSGGT
jgi:glycosyltransferase involved in cell wall biosynthesis